VGAGTIDVIEPGRGGGDTGDSACRCGLGQAGAVPAGGRSRAVRGGRREPWLP
jgi:hypothetical protein